MKSEVGRSRRPLGGTDQASWWLGGVVAGRKDLRAGSEVESRGPGKVGGAKEGTSFLCWAAGWVPGLFLRSSRSLGREEGREMR